MKKVYFALGGAAVCGLLAFVIFGCLLSVGNASQLSVNEKSYTSIIEGARGKGYASVVERVEVFPGAPCIKVLGLENGWIISMPIYSPDNISLKSGINSSDYLQSYQMYSPGYLAQPGDTLRYADFGDGKFKIIDLKNKKE